MGKLIAMLLLVSGLLSPAFAATRKNDAITLAHGQIRGIKQGDLTIFKGVPYAAPPVGPLRWRPPQPALAWNGVYEAKAFGPSCMQPAYPANSVYYSELGATSEDCLTLNIWLPEQARNAPVVVWIHGGALSRGSGYTPMTDGAEFAKRGVVFVSINYRLGIFGWLAHPQLSLESPDRISGNYGLLDQIAALRWVKGNIGAFGGNSRNVTVMGESAGALSISYLLTSPRAKGLFSKAIMQSANIRAVPYLRKAAFGLRSAEELGENFIKQGNATDIDALRNIPAAELVKLAQRASFASQGTIDGHILPMQVVESFDRGLQARVPILAGFNSGEIRSQKELVPKVTSDPAVYEREIRTRYADLADAFLKLYPAADIENSMLLAVRDAVYGWASEHMVARQSGSGVASYMYIFDHCDAAAHVRELCAFHASELPYVFGRTGAPENYPPNWPVANGEADRELSAAMLSYWVSFARTDRPSAPGMAIWTPYGDAENYVLMSTTPKALNHPVPGMLELNRAIYQRRSAANQQWFTNLGPAAPLRAESGSRRSQKELHPTVN